MLNDTWDKRFLAVAKEISTWSKDPSKKIGAIIVKDKRILATGVHAEMNAIYNAAANGISCKDATLYVYGLPVCSNCAKGIVQTGINRIVMDATDVPQRWIDSFDKTKDMFDEVGIAWSLTMIKRLEFNQ